MATAAQLAACIRAVAQPLPATPTILPCCLKRDGHDCLCLATGRESDAGDHHMHDECPKPAVFPPWRETQVRPFG